MNNKILRILLAAIVLTGTATTLSAKKITYNISGRPASGFNSMDLRLQKPLPNDTFPADESSFKHHIFLGLGAGVSAMGDSFTDLGKPGFNFTGRIGGWFTPIHGIRLTGGVGSLSVHSGTPRTWYGTIGAEYLLNLSALQYGYDPERRFELIGAVGLEGRVIRQSKRGGWGTNVGVTAALQLRYNADPSLYLFAEPKLAVMTGSTNYDYPNTIRRIRPELSLSIGLGYRILQGKYRKAASQPFTSIKDDNIYFGIEGGLMGFPRHSNDYSHLFGEAYVGRQITSESAVQASMSFGRYRSSKGADYRSFAIGSLDYVLNIANACSGYRPDNVFSLLANIGVSGAVYSNPKDGRSISPGLSAGITGMFRLSPNWSLTLHPQMYLFKEKFSRNFGISNSPLIAFMVGLRYTIGDFSSRFPESYEDFEDADKWFIMAGGGFNHRFRGNYGDGFNGSIGFGKRFTPVSSWRITIDGDMYPKAPLAISGTLHADYLTSLTTAMMGYDPDRLLDIQASIGAFGGIANYVSGVKPTYGLSAGLQAGFRLNSQLDLYIEPQFHALCTPNIINHMQWTPEMRINVGLRYKLGNPDGKVGDLLDTPYGEKRDFISVATGPNIINSMNFGRNGSIKGMLDLALGRWFNTVSGVRLTFSNDWSERFNKADLTHKTYLIEALHADYLLNFTSLMTQDSARRFHIIGAVGLGVGFSNGDDTKSGLMTYGGLQFRYNLPWYDLDVHIEPGLNFWANRLVPYPSPENHFTLGGRIAVGASLRF